jgi:hypothetical protein
MKRNWSFFSGAAVLAWYFLRLAGAPIPAIVAGIGLGAFMTYRSTRSA